jgi:hypothetical protein
MASDDTVILLSRFVLRARRVLESRFARGEDVSPTVPQDEPPSGLYNTLLLADEESVDAAAARVRPLLLDSHGEVYWERVLDALGEIIGDQRPNDRETTWELRRLWEEVRKPPRMVGGDRVTDRQLADRFLYGDLVHADVHPPPIPDFVLRLYSAQSYVHDAVRAVRATLEVVHQACQDGQLELPSWAWDDAVTVAGQRKAYLPVTRADWIRDQGDDVFKFLDRGWRVSGWRLIEERAEPPVQPAIDSEQNP